MSDLDPIVTDGPGVSIVSDHPFTPRGEWWSVCGHRRTPLRGGFCGLAEAAHATSSLVREQRPTVFPTRAAQEPMGEHADARERGLLDG